MNVANIRDCYGCGVCALACPKKIITMELDADGFYAPRVDEGKCIDCSLCVKVCAYSHTELSQDLPTLACYAAWSRDARIRRKCSSGGVGFEVAKSLLGEGYKVCGVRYSAENGRAEHFVATTREELVQTMGSKYIQSYTPSGFLQMSRRDKYLITGTPCQIDSFRRYIRNFRCEDNFVLMDFFCHGTPSMLLWQCYARRAEARLGKLTYASWRNKLTGWHDSWAMSMDGTKHGGAVDWNVPYDMLLKDRKSIMDSRLSQGDSFYRLFLGNVCLGKACYKHCKYKYSHSAADIRIGDLWGKAYAHDDKGVSGAIAFTDKGRVVLEHTDCELAEHPLEVVAEGQIRQSVRVCGAVRRHVMDCLREDRLEEAVRLARLYTLCKRWSGRLSNPRRALRNFLHRG